MVFLDKWRIGILIIFGLFMGLCSADIGCLNLTECASSCVISNSSTLCKDYYTGAIIIKGNDLVLDCNGVILDGANGDIGIRCGGSYNEDVHNITIKNCNLRNYNYGISLHGNNNIVDNNTIISSTSSNGGIYLHGKNNTLINNIISANNVTETGSSGIFLYYFSSNNRLVNNTVNSHGIGIYLKASRDNVITNNTVEENMLYDIFIDAEIPQMCSNIIENNTGSGGRPIKYFNYSANIQNEVLSELILCNAINSNINNVTVIGSSNLKNNGVIGEMADNITFIHINSSNNMVGIHMGISIHITLINSTLSSNRNGGFHAMDGSILVNNIISSNIGNGVCISGGGNTLINNTANSNNGHTMIHYDTVHNLIINYAAYSYDGGIHVSGGGNTLINNTANSNDGNGISVGEGSTIIGNTANANSNYGFLVSGGSNSITDNTVTLNNYGLYLCSSGSSDNNIISDNTFSNNTVGLYLKRSLDNLIQNNAILYNNIGVFFEKSNSSVNSNTVCFNTKVDINASNSKKIPSCPSADSNDTGFDSSNSVSNLEDNTCDMWPIICTPGLSEQYVFISGNNNTCGTVSDWNDSDRTACTNSCTPTLNYTIPLKTGWNLISIPLVPVNASIDAILEGIDYEAVFAWNTSSKEWSYRMYIGGSWWGDLDKIVSGKGYWIKPKTNTALTVTGTEFKGNISLYPGWNLIGWPSLNTVLFNNISLNYASIYAYNTDWIYRTYVYSVWFGTLDRFEHGKGYWIKVDEEGVIEF